ncbi:MAG: response regulator [Actinomycetes bacterium]|jgi:CheY-like chemotaxis protein
MSAEAGLPADRAKILLVDDRPENLLALEAILSSLDQTLVRATSGEEALKALLADDFAVILLDVQMPGMDGFETAAHIKRRERTRDIPIIFLTAISREPQHAFRGYSAGAVDYLAKPFDPWVLRAKVQVFVELYLKNRQLREQSELLRRQLATRPGTPADAVTQRQANGLVDDLVARLAGVEDQVDLLTSQAKVTVDPTIGEHVVELAHRVARLRAAVQALQGGEH